MKILKNNTITPKELETSLRRELIIRISTKFPFIKIQLHWVLDLK